MFYSDNSVAANSKM